MHQHTKLLADLESGELFAQAVFELVPACFLFLSCLRNSQYFFFSCFSSPFPKTLVLHTWGHMLFSEHLHSVILSICSALSVSLGNIQVMTLANSLAFLLYPGPYFYSLNFVSWQCYVLWEFPLQGVESGSGCQGWGFHRGVRLFTLVSRIHVLNPHGDVLWVKCTQIPLGWLKYIPKYVSTCEKSISKIHHTNSCCYYLLVTCVTWHSKSSWRCPTPFPDRNLLEWGPEGNFPD
jgi:hypothetical protein